MYKTCLFAVLWSVATLRLVYAVDVDFDREVRPLLANLCYECHGPDEDARVTDMRLDDLANVVSDSPDEGMILRSDPAQSELMRRLVSGDEMERMPPPESPRQPTDEQIETIRQWIEQGAHYESHWAFTPPIRCDVPSVSDSDWPIGELDRFVFAHLEHEGRSPQSDAPATVLARRLSLAVTGLPVSPEEMNRFAVAFESDPDETVNQFVDDLLCSEAYGEHFAWDWLDAARYADTNGYQADSERTMWPWRDWLVRSLNDNVPFHKMTERMLAGDLMMPDPCQSWQSGDWIEDAKANELLLATGFLRNHRYDTGSGTIPAESIFENATDRAETVATVWMGLTMKCARCHTHKYDPIENEEYYEFLSFFDNVPEVGSALKGASHPYIHVASSAEQDELESLRHQMVSARQAFINELAKLDGEQRKWEAELPPSDDASTMRVNRSLQHRYAEEAIEFDGETTIEHTNDPIKLCAGNLRWTLSFWFQANNEDDMSIFSSIEDPDRDRVGIQADIVDRRLRIRHVCRWINSYIEFVSNDLLQPGQWYHATISCDGRMQGPAYQAVLNGQKSAMRCTHEVTNDNAAKAGKAPLVLGGSPLLPGFVGSLKDLRFYDRVLLNSEIQSLADPRSIQEIVCLAEQERTSTEQNIVDLAFQESDGLPNQAKQLRDAMHATSAAYDAAITSLPTTMVMQELEVEPTRVRRMGVFDQLGETVLTDMPEFLPPLGAHDASRIDLARWLTRPDHPLTTRVAVNRIWQTLWGRGFVESSENFGIQCPRPLHADLLDFLAIEYVQSGWDTKALVKRIVTSRTYRQSSSADEQLWEIDPNNQLLARGPRFRLPVNVIRDQALFLSGRLDRTVGGPPVSLDAVFDRNGKPKKVSYEEADTRRTLYTYWARNAPHPMLAVFDVADRNQCDVRVRRTNTPLQALVTLNESGFAECAKTLSGRAAEFARTDADQLRWIWQSCTGRIATDEQLDLLQSTLDNYRNLVDEETAWMTLGNVMLNLDATITLE